METAKDGTERKYIEELAVPKAKITITKYLAPPGYRNRRAHTGKALNNLFDVSIS
jgi:hypothetical protein